MPFRNANSAQIKAFIRSRFWIVKMPQVRTSLEVVETQFRLLIFEAAFNVPTREGHQQQFAQRRVGRCIADEGLHLVALSDT